MFILNTDAEVRAAASPVFVGRQFSKSSVGCVACHESGAPDLEKLTLVMTLPDTRRVLRNCNPIENRDPCHQCHDPNQRYNGVLITDLSLSEIEQHAGRDLQRTLLLMSGALLLGAVLG